MQGIKGNRTAVCSKKNLLAALLIFCNTNSDFPDARLCSPAPCPLEARMRENVELSLSSKIQQNARHSFAVVRGA